jgi:hypothetical protein
MFQCHVTDAGDNNATMEDWLEVFSVRSVSRLRNDGSLTVRDSKRRKMYTDRISPCGGRLENFHCSSATRKRRQFEVQSQINKAVKYGLKFCGTWTRKWQRWQDPVANLRVITELCKFCRVRRLLVTAHIVPSSLFLITLIMEALRSSETRFLQEPHDVTSQKTTFFNYRTVLSSERVPDSKKNNKCLKKISVKEKTGCNSHVWPDTRTDWPTGRRSYDNFDVDFPG